MQATWVLAIVACAAVVTEAQGASHGRSLSTIRLSPSNVGSGSYPNASLTVELPTGCTPYSVRSRAADTTRCPKSCILGGFDNDTNAEQPTAPLIIRVARGQTSRVALHVKREVNYLTPNKSSIPDDEGFRFTTRQNSAELLARYKVPDDARPGSEVSVIIGHMHRDPSSDTAKPDPKLPLPTCLVRIVWVVSDSSSERGTNQPPARAPSAYDDAFGGGDAAPVPASDFGSDASSTKRVKSADDSSRPPRGAAAAPRASPTAAPDGFRRRLLAA